MTHDDKILELAGSLAKGESTVSGTYVLQGDRLLDYLHELPQHSPLPAVRSYWSKLGEKGSLPSRQHIDPTELSSSVLPHIVIIDIDETPHRRFRYRLVGTAVTGVFGADYTGSYMDELGLGDVFARIQAFYSLVCNDPQPALLNGYYETRSGLNFNVSPLVMPLSEDGVTIDSLFCAFVKS